MSAMPLFKQGESVPFVFSLNGAPIDGWICTIFVKQFPGDVAIISRVISPQGRAWPGFLTEEETSILDPSTKSPWFIIGKLENASTSQEKQIDEPFNLTRVWA